MNSALKWFARTESETQTTTVEDVEENRLDTEDLPAHVQEFLALKAAAGF